MSDDDLDLRPTDELVEALFKRFEHAILSGYNTLRESADGSVESDAVHYWNGNGIACIGLAAECKHRILNARTRTSNDQNP